jgi:hypothetical protein
MDFFLFSIRPENTYQGTLSFHFQTPSSLPSSSSSSSLVGQEKEQQQQQQPAKHPSTPPRGGGGGGGGGGGREEGREGGREGGPPLVLTVRVHGDGRAPTIFEGLPEDEQITAHVYCSLDDFLFIYSGDLFIYLFVYLIN